MKYKVLFFIVFLLLFFPGISIAQKELSVEESKNFFNLIRQTKEYKNIKEKTDSVNRTLNENDVPHEVNIEIIKKDQGASSEDFIFKAVVERRLAVGFVAERCYFQYDKHKRQIVSVTCQKTKYEIN